MDELNPAPREQELNFEAFIKAVSTVNLGEGVDTAACHHSAVEIRDWDRIQEQLKNLAAREHPGVGVTDSTA